MKDAGKVEISLLDICYPEWFRGTSDFSLAVFFSPDMSKTEMISAIDREVQGMMEFPFDYDAFDVAMRAWVEEFHDWVIRDLWTFTDDTWEEGNRTIPYAYLSVVPVLETISSDTMSELMHTP